MVSCGKCNVEILKSQWSHHNLSLHNDLGWVKGTTKPNFENDEKLLKRILFNAIKRRKGNLVCEICNVIKRSVLGFLSHTTFCGKDEEEKRALMVTCPICDAVTKPSSLEYHERMHKLQTEEKQKTNFSEADDINLGSKIKRKAAEKAITKISQFTAIVNDKDDKDCLFSSDKKLKLNFSSVKKLIQKPQLMKKIPSTLLGKWKKNLNIGEYAICNQAGCQFNSKSLNEIKQHYAVCNFTPQENFSCKICQFQTLSENEIVSHALQKHSIEDNYDIHLSLSDTESFSSDNIDEIDKESEKNPGLQKKFFFKESIKSSNKIFRFLFKDGVCHTKLNKPFYTAFQWTLEFEKKNYKFNLFKELVPNTFKLLSVNESKEYFPIIEQSMLMKSEKTNNEDLLKSKWKKWKRFEGHCIQDNPTFFAGGPIWALAWLPIPSLLAFSKNISQFIAVSTHPTMDIEFSVGKIYTKKNIIQIWNFGDLNNKTSNMYNPKLAYAIIHEGGTVWCLDWCPSGCYQHEQLPGFINENGQPKRMGLLAAACSDGCVRIYSLIFPEDLPSYSDCNKTINNFDDKKVENIYPIYNTEPVLQLIVNLEMFDQKQQIWQVTKLSWTKENEHNVIVAGFSNGYIALWDLTSKSSMLKTKRGNTIFLNSYRHFFAHHHAITMAYLIPQDNKRFLATASLDRHYKFWDLEDITNPRNFLKKSFVTDGSWLNNWHCALIAYDDALSMNHSYSYCLPLREYTYKYYNLLPTNSTSYTISTSDFGNSIANGTLAGEVLAIFPEQLLYIRDMDKTLPRKRHISIVSSLELIDFQNDSKSKESVQTKKREKNDNIDYNYMPSTYIDSNDRFGLKFCDKINFFRDEYSSEQPKNHKKTLTCEMMKNVPIEQYPFTSVNRLAWNPNAWSFLWLAVGYQNGFVRLISFKSLASTEYNKLLISHIETIKSDE
ncbi:PREDICTED: general transcription factor 3C polypeptide 2 [Ceratosolen solmsi marchali]|uniref:General transcription factor 3C polypeptide 2 n=1 Tax=Ceratosolen solmsi marchali TaxID=326594 RepID=A0AAJ6YL06_9HYME|nr:PREDICTED: general transcription factor 3C polypeptide 2 [Ceratosolen solmsi marchali]